MKQFIIFFFCLSTANLIAQGDMAMLTIPATNTISTEYDGKENYLQKKVYLYIGQTLWLKKDAELEKKDSSFILGFTTSYKRKKDEYGTIYPETYRPSLSGVGTDYHEISNNYFKVLDVLPHPKANSASFDNKYNKIYYLKLHNLTLGDIAYYEYRVVEKEIYFPFIVIKHLNYLEKKHIGEIYQIIVQRFDYVSVKSFKTGENIDIQGKSWWKCINIVLDNEEGELSLVLEKENNQILVPLKYAKYYINLK